MKKYSETRRTQMSTRMNSRRYLYRALSALGGRSAKIAIVAFGHPACNDCFCLFKLLGDVVPKTRTVPAALCPRGLNHRNVSVDCCVYTLDW